MEPEKSVPGKSNVGAIIITVIVTAALVGGGVYMWQRNQAEQPAPAAINQEATNPPITTPTKTEPTEPLSYSTTGVAATVAKKTAPFDYTADQLRSMAEECGNGKVSQPSDYFKQLVEKFKGAEKTIYNFKYTGASQATDTFTVTLLPNKAGYTSLDQFKKDFEICAAGGELYPSMMNANWLLFTNTCGSGASDGSGRPIGCEKVREIVEPTLALNSSIAE